MSEKAFVERVQNHEPAEPIMSLAHTTTAEALYHILTNDAVQPRHTFNRRLTSYFFYGVNSYVPNTEFSTGISRPVGFLLKSDVLTQARFVYPFDTGAHQKKLYGEFLDDDVDSYEIPADPSDVPARLVKVLYDTNENYVRGKTRPKYKSATLTENKLMTFVDNARTRLEPQDFDERCYGIEVQFCDDLSFKENVELIILPRYAYTEELKGLYEGKLTGIPVRYYDDISLYGPKMDSALIRQKAIEYLREQGVLGGAP